MNVKGIIILVVSAVIFDLLFMQLNKFNPKIFSFFHKVPEKWKGKLPIKWIAIFILLLINALIKVYLGFSDLLGYIIAGFIISLCDFGLKKTKQVSK